MVSIFQIVIVLVVVSLSGGCASMRDVRGVLAENSKKDFSNFGFKESEEAISTTAPEWERSGITAATLVIGVLHPTLYPEYPEEIVAEGELGGVWPSVAKAKPKPIKGEKCFYTDKGPKGVHLTLTLFPAALDPGTPIVDLSRDGSIAFSQMGIRLPTYRIDEFQKKEEHRDKVFQESLTLGEIEEIWTEYLGGRQSQPFVRVVRIPSAEWDEVKDLLRKIMPHDYKMVDGSIRWGYIPLKEYKAAASKNHGVTGAKRFVREFRPDLLSFVFNPIGAAIDNGSRVVTSGIAAKLDKTWTGPYLGAEVKKEAFTNHFLLLEKRHQDAIKKRDEVIQEQAAKIKALEGNRN